MWPLRASRRSPRLALIAAASLAFHDFWAPRCLLILLGTAVCDVCFGLAMSRAPRARHVLLAASLTGNLGAPFAFKHASFAARAGRRA